MRKAEVPAATPTGEGSRLYETYGLILRSDRPLHTVLPCTRDAAADLDVTFAGDELVPWPGEARVLAKIEDAAEEGGGCGSRILAWDKDDGTHIRLHYFGNGNQVDFDVGPGRDHIRVAWSKTLGFADVESLLAGAVMSALLRLRGHTGLHASVVTRGQHTIAIAGPSGAGKSTTAAALVALGYAVVADDVALIEERDGAVHVVSAGPRLRLWPSGADAAGLSGAEAPRVFAVMEKRIFWLAPGPEAQPRTSLPLTAIYVLTEPQSDTDEIRLEPIRGGAAIVTLAAQIYATSLLDRSQRPAEFALLRRIAARVPLRRVHRRRSLARIGELARTVADDAAGLGARSDSQTAPSPSRLRGDRSAG